MTDEQLAEIRARLEAAYMVDLGTKGFRDVVDDSAMFADISKLLAEVDRLRAEKREAAMQRLAELGQEMDAP